MIQTLLVVLVCTSVGASSYYGRFGNHPSMSLVDFAEAPSAFVAYSGSDVRPGDVILSALGVVSRHCCYTHRAESLVNGTVRPPMRDSHRRWSFRHLVKRTRHRSPRNTATFWLSTRRRRPSTR